MREDNHWRQLGSIVNTVLADAKTQAIRKGALSKQDAAEVRAAVPTDAFLPSERRGHGFLSAGAAPQQLQFELTFASDTAH